VKFEFGGLLYIVQVLLTVILQGSKVDHLTVTTKKEFDAAVAEAATAIFAATTISEKMVSEIQEISFQRLTSIKHLK